MTYFKHKLNISLLINPRRNCLWIPTIDWCDTVKPYNVMQQLSELNDFQFMLAGGSGHTLMILKHGGRASQRDPNAQEHRAKILTGCH